MADLSPSVAPARPVTRWSAGLARWRWRDEAIGVVMVGFGGLLVAVLAPLLLPMTFLVHLEQGRLHAGVGFALCAVALLILRAPLRGFVSGLVASWLIASTGLFVWQVGATHAPDRAPEFKLVAFNMLGTNPRGDEIAAFLMEEAPDVVFALEAGPLEDDLEAINAAFPHRAGCWPGPRCDMAVFSKHPLRHVDVQRFVTVNGRLIRADMDVAGQTVTLIAAHLTKPYWGAWHARQMDQLAEVLADVEGPVVLAGDFNSMPFATAFQEALFERSGMQLASGMQPTWPALSSRIASLAGFAIDHVMVRGAITPVATNVIDDPIGSNHRGLVSTFDLDGR